LYICDIDGLIKPHYSETDKAFPPVFPHGARRAASTQTIMDQERSYLIAQFTILKESIKRPPPDGD